MTALQVVWLRSDLRCYDNAALFEAMQQGPTIALFIATPKSWQQHDMAPVKQQLIRGRIEQMTQELTTIGVPLLAVEGSDYDSVLTVFTQLLSFNIAAVHCEVEYEQREQQRDAKVQQLLGEHGVKWCRYDRLCGFAPGSICTGDGGMYKVFTPFKRNWLQRYYQQGMTVLAKPKAQAELILPSLDLPVMQPAAELSSDWPVAEATVLERMRDFCQHKVRHYKAERDFPAIDATSMISPYLAIGLLSVRQCIKRLELEAAGQLQQADSGAATWLSELIWRDFYKHVLVAWPDLIKHQPFQPYTSAIRWSSDEALFSAWCEGRTGYPLVDAAMRQLNQTGWMHNRLRMVVASFLVKDLHLDWRWGERYFMSRLIDGDFAANNGGWQWAASTGTDAVPYFRIFNPVTQSKRFDPDGDFIRKFVPELANVPAKQIHWPHPVAAGCHYPAAIVDHAIARQRTLELYQDAKS
ncbi:deoxyribodipyrimidine photo-lyase [Alkalimonas collagenimarina]|uniref:Deoxyribodipyrimidine photo-lyase n=1 Tax=Alkalimonas collagenimarina TaxID=400390 RepID=A0ABT9H082_9GAMM|nr:deoxyribodipyrimidine photo-lyase [Alkalimonas collagenimarina]MDP4536722.1 deoxyribodipyrimidine photo-lyase [Alkalimonas collagenimarina]